MNNFFAPHGEFTLNISNNIIIARVSGSWNEECAHNFSAALKEKINSFNDKEWAHYVLLDDWELGVPEVTPIISDLVAYCIDHRLIKSAHIFNESVIKQTYIDQMVTEKQGNFEKRMFHDKTEAIKWLNASGFSLSSDIDVDNLV
jgi:hypothetical protein